MSFLEIHRRIVSTPHRDWTKEEELIPILAFPQDYPIYLLQSLRQVVPCHASTSELRGGRMANYYLPKKANPERHESGRIHVIQSCPVRCGQTGHYQ
ncbi:hypothetical protein CCP3SC1AL1_640014 [Gammaproteobacteria bacterium]